MSTRKDIILITGANAGLGYHAAFSLCSSVKCDNIIVLAGRNVEASNTAADTIARETGIDRSNLLVLHEKCDLSDLESVRSYVLTLKAYLEDKNFRIKKLVNNAGIGGSATYSKNKVGHECIFATNHLGHFLLTILLLPYIDERIVNVSSEVHDHDLVPQMPDASQYWPTNEAEYESRLLQGEPIAGENERNSGSRRYCRSKLCNVFFSNELARRLSNAPVAYASEEVVEAERKMPGGGSCTLSKAKEIKVISYNPGAMLDSNFVRTLTGSRIIGGIAYFLTPLLRFTSLGHVLRSAPLSGSRLARLTQGEIDNNATATFFSDEAAHPSSKFSRSLLGVTQYQLEVWNFSIKWAGITDEEIKLAGL